MRRSGRLARRVVSVKVEYDEGVSVKDTAFETDDKVKLENGVKIEADEVPQVNGSRSDLKSKVKREIDDDIKTEIKRESSVLNAPLTGDTPLHESTTSWLPPNWKIYEMVKEMRKHTIAPVDTMGCERLPENVSSTTTPKMFRYQLLVALMLSSQTKDTVNAIAMANLRTELKGGLTVQSILDTDEKTIDKLIYKVGFHTRKAGYIKKATQILRDNYDDDIPPSIDEMISLPGVGPKMAHLLMHRAWGKVEGIGVDVHVHRMAGMWKWTKNAKTPEQTRLQLEEWLPRDLWVEINPTLVGFGQTICLPRYPKCENCTISGTRLCPGDKFKYKRKRDNEGEK